jgi:hypothetical protein
MARRARKRPPATRGWEQLDAHVPRSFCSELRPSHSQTPPQHSADLPPWAQYEHPMLDAIVATTEEKRMQPEQAAEVLDRALATQNRSNGAPHTPLPEPMYHDAYVTAWRQLDSVAYEALAQARAQWGQTSDRYSRFTRMAAAVGRSPREVLALFCLDALLAVINGGPPGADDAVRAQATTAYVEALNAVRLLHGWDLLQPQQEDRL